MSGNQTTEVGLPAGTKVGKYQILQRLAIGGQAIVYKAHDQMLDRFVAIKQISTHLAEDPKFLERFQREAQILAKLGAEQSTVVNVLDMIQDERGLFMVMEFVAGHTLEDSLQDNPGPVETKAVLAILWRLVAGLHAVHQAGVIHRDLKPGNIIIGAGLKCKIMDFGVAATKDGQTSMVLGTTKYMAPELYEGKDVDARADMYSLGFITYEMLLGRTKFNELFADVVRDKHSEHLRWMKWHGNESLTAPPLHELRPELPRPLSDIVAKMMAKKPADRYTNMEELGRLIKTSFTPRPAGAAGQGGHHHKKRANARPEAPAKLSAFTDDEPSLDYQPLATTPLPKRQLSLKTKLIIAGAISICLVAGLATALIISRSGEEQRNRKIAAAYTDIYKLYEDQQFAKAAAGFDDFINNYPKSPIIPRAKIYQHLAAGKAAVEQAEAATDDKAKEEKWKTASEEGDHAYATLREAQAAGATEWTEKVEADVKAFQSSRPVRKQFQEDMDKARAHLASNAFDDARKDLASCPDTGIQSRRDQRLSLLKEIDTQECEFKYRSGIAQAKDAMAKNDFVIANDDLARTASMLNKDDKFKQLTEARLEAMKKEVEVLQKKLASTSEFSKDMVDAEQALNDAQGLKASDPARALARKADALTALKNANGLQPSTELADRITAVDAELAYDDGMNQLARQDFDEAKKAFKKSLAIKELPQAKAELEKLEGRQKRKELLDEADKASQAKDWQKALDKYTAALAASDDGPDAKEIHNDIAECKYNLKIAAAKKLAEQHKYPEASSALEDARQLMPEKAPDVGTLQAAFNHQRDYETGLALVNNYMKKKQYAEAIAKLKKMDASAQVQDLLKQAQYEQLLDLGRSAMDQTRYNEAKAYFKQAQGYKDTAEIQTLISQAQEKINQK